ncbi:MAG: FtsX-like permease family protein [Oscillospiraceae bacterium]|nr:FtsX-like permease family protein [Oscillospiraceae bacterium]
MVSIVLLGSSFFVGIRATGPDMRLTAQAYYNEQNYSDIRLLSTLGFAEDDIAALRDVDALFEISPGYTADVLMEIPSRTVVIHLMSYDTRVQTVNKPLLLEGRLPENAGEAAADEYFMEISEYQLGDTVVALAGGDSPLSDTLAQETFVIVGVVRSPLYTTMFNRGGSSIGNGSVDAFMLLPPSAFALEAYTEIYTTIYNPDAYSRFDPAYEGVIAPVKKELEDLGEVLAPQRRQQLVSEAEELLEEAKQKVADAEEAIAEGARKLEDARRELEDGEAEYADALRDFDEQIADGQQQLDDALADLEDARRELEDSDRTLTQGERRLADAQADLDKAKADAQEGQAQLDGLYAEIQARTAQLALIPEGSAEYAALAAQIGYLSELHATQHAELEAARRQIQAGQEELDGQGRTLRNGRAAWERGRTEYREGLALYEQNADDFARERADGEASLAEARQELDDAAEELAEGQREYDTEVAENTSKLEDAKVEIADGEQAIADLADAEWYILDLYTNEDFADFKENCNRIEAVGYLFPLIFFLVAALVSLTSMTRTVEDDRTQIGILKALGYARGQIAIKYIVFALFATIAGLALGLTMGFNFFPRVIASAYGMLYRFPPLIAPVDMPYSLLATALALASTIVPAAVVSFMSLLERPANLMLPKAPSVGKKVILEYLRPLWRRMSFMQKVTTRNILRYKKRMLMTLIGIAGCTALVFTGFGLNDAVNSLVTNQFDRVTIYDVTAQLSSTATEGEREKAVPLFAGNVSQYLPLHMRSVDVDGGGVQKSVSLVCPQTSENLSDFIRLRDASTLEPLVLKDGGVILSEKLARLMGVAVGDMLRIRVVEGKYASLPVTDLTENYFGHYLYMTPDTFTQLFGHAPDTNVLHGNLKPDTDNDALAAHLLSAKGISGVTFITDFQEKFADSVGALGYVVAVLIVSAAALAFVVLFSLSTINMEERRREIATIKVLGFYDREVADYINRETFVLSLLGAGLGLLLGVVLLQYVVATAEIDMIVFSRETSALSYLWSVLTTVAFTLIVNWITGFRLRRVDMVESLKSVE